MQLPVTFSASRARILLLLFSSGIFVVGGIWLWPREPIIGGLCIAFFGLGVIVFAIGLHPKSSFLTLTAEGFTFASLFRKHFVAWSSVQSFTTARIGLNKMVGWSYASDFRDKMTLRRANVALSGIEAGLPDTYGMKAEELCALMNEIRNQRGKSAL